MKLAMIGLGRMGGNMVRRLMRDGHECVVYARHAETVREFEQLGATGATSLADVVAKLAAPRVLWVMLPSGEPTATAISELAALVSPGDIIIDGGNSFWKDDVAHARALAAKGIRYVDVGVSGGVWGLERGYCLMIGGPDEAVELLDPIFATLAPGAGKIGRTPGREGALSRPERGYVHVGPSGAGHFVKMVHNGIEYGMMQAYAEGFDLLRSANTEARPEDERFTLNTAEIAEVWRRGSVVSSWLLDLTAQALAADGDLQRYSGVVSDSGEGRWTINAAIEQATPVNVLAAALFERFRSRQEHSFADKLLSAMREGFGGHKEASSGS